MNRFATAQFAAVRAGYGAVLLCAPDPVVRLYAGHPADRRTRAVARLLGARHLAQAVGTAGTPGRAVLALGAGADLAHAASMLGLAGWDRPRARAGLVDATGALSFALAGALLVRHSPGRPPPPATTGGTVPAARTWLTSVARPTLRRRDKFRCVRQRRRTGCGTRGGGGGERCRGDCGKPDGVGL